MRPTNLPRHSIPRIFRHLNGRLFECTMPAEYLLSNQTPGTCSSASPSCSPASSSRFLGGTLATALAGRCSARAAADLHAKTNSNSLLSASRMMIRICIVCSFQSPGANFLFSPLILSAALSLPSVAFLIASSHPTPCVLSGPLSVLAGPIAMIGWRKHLHRRFVSLLLLSGVTQHKAKLASQINNISQRQNPSLLSPIPRQPPLSLTISLSLSLSPIQLRPTALSLQDPRPGSSQGRSSWSAGSRRGDAGAAASKNPGTAR